MVEKVEVPLPVEVPRIVEVRHTTREIVEAPLKDIKTCDGTNHEWGRVKQWIVDGVVVQKQKCKWCGVMK